MIPKPKYEPYDTPNRWLIPSQRVGEASYLVDLGMEECQCRFYVCEIAPKQRKGLRPKLCTHYHIAKQRFADWAIWEFAQRDHNLAHDTALQHR